LKKLLRRQKVKKEEIDIKIVCLNSEKISSKIMSQIIVKNKLNSN